MEQRFLVFTVAFLFVLTGCGRKKKEPIQKKVLIINAGQISKKQLIAHSFNQDTHKKKKPAHRPVDSSSFSESLKERVQSLEARLADIPTPVMAQTVSVSDDAHGCYTLVYETTLSFADLKKFYLQEMGCAGWHKGACFEGEEFLCSFKKNNSSCIISLRPSYKHWGMTYPATIYLYVQR